MKYETGLRQPEIPDKISPVTALLLIFKEILFYIKLNNAVLV